MSVAAYIGIKPAAVRDTPATASETSPDQMGELSEIFGERAMPKIMSPEEYMAQKNGMQNGR